MNTHTNGTDYLRSLAKPAPLNNLVLDANREPIRMLVERDKRGRFITPRYDFIYAGGK